jgi:hypothetical protein
MRGSLDCSRTSDTVSQCEDLVYLRWSQILAVGYRSGDCVSIRCESANKWGAYDSTYFEEQFIVFRLFFRRPASTVNSSMPKPHVGV